MRWLLPSRAPEAAAELLGEHGRRRGRPQQEDAVDVGHVDALAEHLDGEDAPELARSRARASARVRSRRRGSSPVSATLARPASVNLRAM